MVVKCEGKWKTCGTVFRSFFYFFNFFSFSFGFDFYMVIMSLSHVEWVPIWLEEMFVLLRLCKNLNWTALGRFEERKII